MTLLADMQSSHADLVALEQSLLGADAHHCKQMFLYQRSNRAITWLFPEEKSSTDEQYVSFFYQYDTRLPAIHHLQDTEVLDPSAFAPDGALRGTFYEKYLKPTKQDQFFLQKRSVNDEFDLVMISAFDMAGKDPDTVKSIIEMINDGFAQLILYEIDAASRHGAALAHLAKNIRPTMASVLLSRSGVVLRSSPNALSLLGESGVGTIRDYVILSSPLDRLWLDHALSAHAQAVIHPIVKNVRSRTESVAGSFRLTGLSVPDVGMFKAVYPHFLLEYESFLEPQLDPLPIGIGDSADATRLGRMLYFLGRSVRKSSLAERMRFGRSRLGHAVRDLGEEVGSEEFQDIMRIASVL